MQRCSALTVNGHEDFSNVRSLGNPEKALANLSMTLLTAMALEPAVKSALDQGITEDEMQDLVNFAWTVGRRDHAAELSRLVSQFRGFTLPKTSVIKLVDHETLVRDTGLGAGVAIVLLHALSMDASMWRAIYPRLARDSGCRVIMYDIRGF